MSEPIPKEIPVKNTNVPQLTLAQQSLPKPIPLSIPPNTPLSPEQLHQLRSQIAAYKLLTRKISIPIDLYKHTQKLSHDDFQLVQMRYGQKLAASRGVQNAEKFEILDRTVPGNLRGKDKAFFIDVRKKYVHDLMDTLQNGPTKLHLEKEYHMLCLKDFQHEMRRRALEEYNIRREVQNDRSARALETSLLDKDFYKRMPTAQSIRSKQEARIIAKFELAMRNGQELKKRNKHSEFITELMNFHRDFYEFHKKKYGILRKLANNVRGHLDWKDRQELSRKEKNEKERLRALKSNDIDAYIDLINNTKNNRLLEIIHQTDKFLRELGAKVKLQKGEKSEQDDDLRGSGDEEDVNNEQIAESFKNSSKMYYNITHTVHEEIKEQPEGMDGGILKNYQLIGLQWLISLYNNNLHGILADEMGLGKTIQTIALFQYLIEKKGNYGPFLVVVPLSTLSNWMVEFCKWAPRIRTVVYKGPPQHRKKLITNSLTPGSFNVLITTYEYIMKDKQQLCKFQWSYIVVDEGHRMKNAKSKFAQILGLQYQSDHRLLLTGTPLQNNLSELWSLLNFLLPKIFLSLDDFEKWFNQPFAKLPGEKHVELNEEENLLIINRLHQVLRPFLLRRVKKEVESELPDKVEFVLKIEISAWQRKLYRDIQEKGSLGRDPSTGIIKNLNNSVMQLRKACNHPYLFLSYDHLPVTDEIWRCSGKFELLDRVLPKFIITKHKVLIFSQMTQLMDIMQKYFDYRGFKHLRLDGTTKADDRDRRRELFNLPNSEYHIFLLSTRAGGLGLNLQSADTVIIFDSDWNPQMDLQAQDRAHRIGQTSEVRVYRLVTNTKIEETILTKAAFKKDVDAKVIQAGLFNTKSTDLERRERLKNLLKTEEDEDSESENEFMSDEQLNEIISRNDDEFDLFEKIDQERYTYENYGKERLLSDDHLPDWLKAAEEEALEKEYGRGYRERKPVSYAEEYTENQWNKIMESSPESLPMKRSPSDSSDLDLEKRVKYEESDDDFEVEAKGTKIRFSSRRRNTDSEISLDEHEEEDLFLPND